MTPGMFPGGTSWTAPTTIAAYEAEVVVVQQTTGVLAAFTAPATDRYLLLQRLILDGGGGSAATSQGLVVGPGAGPIRFQEGTIRGTALERVVVDGGQGVELLRTTVQGGLAGAALRVQGASHGFLLQHSRVETSPEAGVEIVRGEHTQTRVTQTVVTGNAAAGVALDATGVLLDNTVIAGNGRGVWIQDGATATRLVNLTIADTTGVGIQIDELALDTSLTNVLLWGNGTALTDLGAQTVYASTLLTNPGFVGGGDYRLALATSPAADAGTPPGGRPLPRAGRRAAAPRGGLGHWRLRAGRGGRLLHVYRGSAEGDARRLPPGVSGIRLAGARPCP